MLGKGNCSGGKAGLCNGAPWVAVPSDEAVTGFDDTQLLELMTLPLTTVSPRRKAMAQAVVAVLIGNGGSVPGAWVSLPPGKMCLHEHPFAYVACLTVQPL